MTPSNKERALTCAARGWLVFPSYKKKPLVKWGTQATVDMARIVKWWNEWPSADVCIKTGEASNLVVVDWDRYKITDGVPFFPLVPFPDTYMCTTPAGGIHYYFRHPGRPVSNSTSALAEYVDVRGDGGMVVAYNPGYDPGTLETYPEAWIREKQVPTTPLAPVSTYEGEGDGMTLAVDLLQSFADSILRAPEGTLNVTLFQCAADIFKMVAAGQLREESAIKLLTIAATSAGHPIQGAYNTIMSARAKGMQEPTSCVDIYWRMKGRG